MTDKAMFRCHGLILSLVGLLVTVTDSAALGFACASLAYIGLSFLAEETEEGDKK